MKFRWVLFLTFACQTALGASSLEISPSLKTGLGSTSNATALEKGEGGQFLILKPGLKGKWKLSNGLIFTHRLSASMKEFTQQKVGDLADSRSARFQNTVYWKFARDWDAVFKGSVRYHNGRIPFASEKSVASIPEEYVDGKVDLNSGYKIDNWLLIAGAGVQARRLQTTTSQIDGSEDFRDSFNRYSVYASAKYRFSKPLKVRLKTTLARKTYLERKAEFTDGQPGSTNDPHPLLATFSNEHQLTTFYRLGGLRTQTSLSVRFTKDKIFGAKDGPRFSIREKIKLSLTSKLRLEPSFRLTLKNFSNYREDPLNALNQGDFRKDWSARVGTHLGYSLAKAVDVNAGYRYNVNRSNARSYVTQSYDEHSAEVGLGIQL